ncbi:Toll/interleukin-1 receptor domain-containing protein [Tanacetum coccineum]
MLRKHKVDHVSPVRLLADDEAIELFRSHAFNEEKHIKDYENFSLQVVSYADGLPLALKVLGSFLYDKDAKEWMSTMDRLRDIPESEIVDKLKISYDGLKPVEKELFLDIACFYRGRLKSDAMEIFDAFGFHPEIGIKVLIQKSLITIDSVGDFAMHDLIQEMGHYIVRREHPHNPEKHSRVWKHAEVSNMCFGDATVENDQIEAIEFGDNIHWPQFIMFISKMKKLRWLRLIRYNEGNVEAPDCLSNELRYIDWAYYSASPFPDTSTTTQVLQLVCLESLVSTPDFNGLPRLQKLKIVACGELEEIHPSLGNHRSLKYVYVSQCSELRMFPTIVRMEQLESLHISYCNKSLVFPEIQANMECLVNLDVYGIQIDAQLSSIGERCTNLIYLSLDHCFNIKCSKVHEKIRLTRSLRKLNLSGFCFEDGEIQSDIATTLVPRYPFKHQEFSFILCVAFQQPSQSPTTLSFLPLLSRSSSHQQMITTKRPDAYVCSFNLFSFKSGLKLLLSATSVGSDRALSSPTILGVSCLLKIQAKANMKCLVTLYVHAIQIDARLSSIGERCTNLISLSLESCFSLNSREVKFDGLKYLKEFRGSKGPGKTPFAFRLTRNLRKLNLSRCYLEDGEIQSDICELSNLQDLNLSYNNFSKLHFSLSQLIRLKRLNLKHCTRLVKLPELPSSIAIIIADGCDKLTTIGDLNEISIKGLEIPKQFTNHLYAGNKCRLPLPENWCNNFCGFLICAVLEDRVDNGRSPFINIKEEASDEMRDGILHDVVWRESFGGKLTWVWYVSFASLRRTEWWNPTRKNVSFHIINPYLSKITSIGIGASLVPMNNGSGLTDTSTDSSEF